jgi:hypothetical protein
VASTVPLAPSEAALQVNPNSPKEVTMTKKWTRKFAVAGSVLALASAAAPAAALAQHGADNPPGDVRGGGVDDGPNHR